MDATIIYYSSNREPWAFEKRVIHDMQKKSNGLPVVSVTQNPISLGKNICVGDVGTSGFNMFRQILLGLYEVKTPYVISAEADCVYSPDYFSFEPKRNDVFYRNNNLYVLYKTGKFYEKPQGSTWAQIVGTQHYIKILEKWFTGAPQWSPEEKSFPKERWGKSDVWDVQEMFSTEFPCISFKSGYGMRKKSPTLNEEYETLPYWGSGKKLYTKFIT
jgi:hypothetical protein